MSWNNEPTAADYAWASANDANAAIKKLEVKIERLQEVVTKLATELDEHWEWIHFHSSGETHLPRGMTRPDPIPSAEEMVEMTLYPEHFK